SIASTAHVSREAPPENRRNPSTSTGPSTNRAITCASAAGSGASGATAATLSTGPARREGHRKGLVSPEIGADRRHLHDFSTAAYRLLHAGSLSSNRAKSLVGGHFRCRGRSDRAAPHRRDRRRGVDRVGDRDAAAE